MKNLTTIAVTMAALAAAPAFAASTASAVLGPLQITLYDLNPSDNIAPSITFSGKASQAYTYAVDDYLAQYPSNSVYGAGTNAFSPNSSTSVTTTSTAAASLTGNGTATGTTLSAMGTALGTTGPANNFLSSYFDASVTVPPGDFVPFTLSSGTKAVFALPVSLSASVTNAYDSANYGYEFAQAAAYVQITVDGSPIFFPYSTSIVIESKSVPDPGCIGGTCYVGDSASYNGVIGGSFENDSGDSMTGQLYAQVLVNGYSYAQAVPVPEPGTYAMLLVGLGAVGLVARRRCA